MLLLLGLLLCSPAFAQTISTSPGPESVSITVYRSPHRGPGEAMNLDWLNGYALVTERRRVTIPAGEAQIRFEGVAGGIIPESVIVTGLPDGVTEKNQDAYLLSPASLLDKSLGKRVHIRRTSLATGNMTQHEAIIRSGAYGAVVLQTEQGFEALRCSGIPETIIYDSIPEGLSAKPTLSVTTRSREATTAVVTLSYLATGFDWQANYIATLAPDEDRMHLFAWVTLANGDETSFVNAETQAVAGEVNREEHHANRDPGPGAIRLQCWPAGTTSDVSLSAIDVSELAYRVPVSREPPPPPPPPAPVSITVTGARMVRQEDLGDLKLYRVPEPVTVASNSQKQVALLERDSVEVETFYRVRLNASTPTQPTAAIRGLTTRNRQAEGLGLPLPAGQVVLFASGRARPILLGEGYLDDRAIGEDVEIEIAEAPGVIVEGIRLSEEPDGTGEWQLIVTNDKSKPVKFEAELHEGGFRLSSGSRLTRRDGLRLWSVTVPANSSATLRYRLDQGSR